MSLEGFDGHALPSNIKLSSCKILLAGNCELPSQLMSSSLPSAIGVAGELLWLEYKRTDLADWMKHATRLVVLATSQDDGHTHVANMPNLKHLELSSSGLHELQLQQQWLELRRLSFFGCWRLNSLHFDALDDPLKQPELKQLCLGGCMSLAQLPEAVSNMVKLRRLDLSGCTGVYELPDNITRLQQLTVLDLRDTQLQSLPEQLGKMSALQELLLRSCTSLTSLPSLSHGQLPNLRVLNMSLCYSLQALSQADLAHLTALTLLGVACCHELQQLPARVLEVLPVSQEELRLNELWRITEVPQQLGRLTALTSLNLSGCLCLPQLPDSVSNFTKLRVLYLSSTSLKVLPAGFTRLAALQHLDLSNCRELEQLPEQFGPLANLEHLDLANCSKLQQPPDFTALPKLGYLNLHGCFSDQPAEPLGNGQPLVFSDIGHAAGVQDQSTEGTVTAFGANLRYKVQGDNAEDVCSIVRALLSDYAAKKLSMEDAHSKFSDDLAEQLFWQSHGSGAAAVICCGVPYTLRGAEQQHVRKCTVTFGVRSMLPLLKSGFFGKSYEVLTIPEQSSPLMFERRGDGGWINWAVFGYFHRIKGGLERFVFFPNIAECSTLLGSCRHSAG